MKFTLEIELGNAAMQTSWDVGQALRELGTKYQNGSDGPDIRDAGKVHDLNGNTVGKWEVTD